MLTEEQAAGVLRLIVQGVAEALSARAGEPVAIVVVALIGNDCHSSGNLTIPAAATLLEQAVGIMRLEVAQPVGPVQ